MSTACRTRYPENEYYGDNTVFVSIVFLAQICFEAYQLQHSDTSSKNAAVPPASSNNPRLPFANLAVSSNPTTRLPAQRPILPTQNAVVMNGRVQPYLGRAAGEPPLQIINSQYFSF